MAPGKKRKRDADVPEKTEPVEDQVCSSFADSVARRAEVFAGLRGGQEIAQEALQVAKHLFDQSLTAEPALLSQYTTSLVDMGVQTRARARRKKGKKKASDNPLLQPTPLSELVTEGLPDEQLWEQLELRASKVDGLVSQLMSGGQEAPASIKETEEMDVDELDSSTALDAGAQDDSDDSDYNEFGEDDAEEIDEEELADSDAEISFTTLNDSKRSPARSKRLALEQLDDGPEASKGSASRKKGSAVDDEFFSLDAFLRDSAQGEDEMRRAMNGRQSRADDADDSDAEDDVDLFAPVGNDGTEEDGDDDDDDSMAGDLEDVGDISYADFFEPPVKAKKPRSSLASLRKEEAESGKRRVSFSEQVMVKPIAARKGTTSFAALVKSNGLNGALAALNPSSSDDEEDASSSPLEPDEDGSSQLSDQESSQEEEEVDFEVEASGSGSDSDEEPSGSQASEEAIQGLKDDLFADDDQDSATGDADGESRYEKRLKALRQQIAALEAENVADKEWTMRGEANAKSRPLNSLLEEDLDFENVAKPVPQVTSEVTASLEERIKKRILDDHFDDVVRRRPFDPAAYLPSRLLDIAGTQSDKSLAELYEDEYSAERQRAEGKEIVHPANARLEKEHKEIEKLYEELCAKLDALSNARFTPRAPQTTITTTSNVPAISLETALPASQAAGTLLAPEEVYAANSGADAAAAKQELTPAEKKAARQRRKRQHAAQEKRMGTLSGGSKKGGSVKSQKNEALTKLVGTRGVTVIGKASAVSKDKKIGKAVQKAQGSMDKRGSAALKL